MSHCFHSSKCYRFFDVDISLSLPVSLQMQWDMLYGAFAAKADDAGAGRGFEIAFVPDDNGGGLLQTGSASHVVAESRVLLHLQDLIQNKVLPAVQSHILWHGAAWNVGGRGVMILADSGVGKTTLSLSQFHQYGGVLSDEISAWHPERGCLDAFPRALAVRPDSFPLCGLADDYPHLALDEDKAMVPISPDHPLPGCPVNGVVFLEWQRDALAAHEDVVEVCVHETNADWQQALIAQVPGLQVEPHPDGGSWWRCRGGGMLKASALERAVKEGGA